MEQNIEEIYKRHMKTVYKYIFCLCNNKSLAEEVTQETFYIAMKSINKFRGECKIQVWLCQIAKHLLYKERKRKRKMVLISMDSEIGEIKSDVNVEAEIIEREEKAELYKQIQKLNGPTKELVFLRLTTELTFKDIAQILGKTEAWTRVEFYRWKEKVKGGMRNETK